MITNEHFFNQLPVNGPNGKLFITIDECGNTTMVERYEPSNSNCLSNVEFKFTQEFCLNINDENFIEYYNKLSMIYIEKGKGIEVVNS